jgi:Spx/MgsR family transcriptional regulator
MIKMYGIPNCDTVKKAKKALEAKGVEFEFVDFKKVSPTKKNITDWKKFMGEWPINKRGTTFRKLKEDFEAASDAQTVNLIIENSSVIKRPVVEKNGKVLCMGLDKEVFEKL